MSWALREPRYLAALHPWRESLMTTANGFLSTRGSLEEAHPDRERATFVHALFVTPPGGVAQQTAVPDWTDLRVTVDGAPLGVDHGWLIGHERRLDLRSGELERRLVWRGEHTATVAVHYRRLLPLHRPETAALEVTIEVLDGAATVAIETGIDASVGSPERRMWRPLGWERPAGSALHLTAASVDDAHHLAVDAVVEAGDVAPPVLIDDPFHHRFRVERRLSAGERWPIAKRVTYRPVPAGEAGRAAVPAALPYEELLDGSRRAWDHRWAGAAIEIDGDPEVELALRYAAFQILAVAPRDDRASIPAKLLSGFGYLGHVFWDADLFMVPWLTTAAPELAANHLAYRWRGLPAARRKAARYGRVGAFYPWEADDRGEECTPDHVIPHAGGPPIEVHTARYEEHITADVAWTTWDHWRWSGNRDELHARWAEIVLDTARYWGGRVEVDADGSGHLREVIGPDEYHERVDDSWFTNRMVRWHLHTAAALLDRLDEEAPDVASRLRTELELPADACGAWRELATRIVLLADADGVPLQHRGFDELPIVDLAAWRPRRTTMERLLRGRVHEARIAKQADVVMALTLLGDETGLDHDLAAAALDRYLPLTDHGSSLSLPVHAWLAARLGRAEQGYELLRAAIEIEHDDSMGNGRFGLHGATNGGLLLATLRGFAGVSPGADGPATNGRLPAHWRGVRFHVHQHDRRYDVEVTGPPVSP